jgi:hypothetical protein
MNALHKSATLNAVIRDFELVIWINYGDNDKAWFVFNPFIDFAQLSRESQGQRCYAFWGSDGFRGIVAFG